MRIRSPRLFRRLLALLSWSRRERDMDREMAFHLESIEREYVRAGMSEADARLAARRRFGRTLQLKEEGHDIRAVRVLDDVGRDVRHVARGLRKSPVFAITVVLTLALGIGGNTAIFSIVDQLLLRPLPYPDGDQLIVVREVLSPPGGGMIMPTANTVSPANWMDWQRTNRTFQDMAAWRTATYTMTGTGEPVRLTAQLVTSEFFPLLRVRPLLGRTPSEADDQPNARSAAVLSYRLWQQRFGGDAAVIGRIVELNDRPVEIIGVMPAGFQFIYPDVDLWGAARLNRAQAWRETSGRFMNVIARMRPGTTFDEARTDMDAIARHLAATHEFNKHSSVRLVPLREELTGQVRTTLIALYAAVGLLLAIACVNVANLLLARAASRRREVALRISLGAGRSAIVRQLLVESLILAIAGGALGVALARWCLDAVMAFAPVGLFRVTDLVVDRPVLFYALAVSVVTGVVVGLAPALLASRVPMMQSLRAGARTIAQSPRLRRALVVCQVALTVVLLCGASLLVQTMFALNGVDTGIDKQDVLTLEVGVAPARYTPERRTAFFRDLATALKGLPGVVDVAAASSLPVVGSPRGGTVFHRLGTPEVPMNERPLAIIRVVTPGYFRALRIPVVRGREFAETDQSTPAPGFIVNEAFAHQFLSGIDPLTASITVWMQDQNPYAPIIGVVGNVRERSIRGAADPTIYYSHMQMAETTMTLFVRAQGASALAVPAVAAVQRLDPTIAVSKIQTIESAFAESVARERLSALVASAFALSGLLLVSLGLYGLVSFLVTERTKEIGIRIALGARLSRLVQSIVGDGLRLIVSGAALGLVASFALLRLLSPVLFGVTPADVPTYAAVLLLVCAVGAMAAFGPACRVSRAEPLIALRHE
jgi:putative ABC transport system permease protein